MVCGGPTHKRTRTQQQKVVKNLIPHLQRVHAHSEPTHKHGPADLTCLSLHTLDLALSAGLLAEKRVTSTLLHALGILNSLLLGGLPLGLVVSPLLAPALQLDGCDQTLDLGSLGMGLATLLGGDLAPDDKLAHISITGDVEEPAQLGGALWPKAQGDFLVSDTRELLLTLLHNDHIQAGNVGANNAATHRFALALTIGLTATATPALGTNGATGQQELDTRVCEDALLHEEALLVLPAGDLDDVALELVAQEATIDILADPLLIEVGQDTDILDVEDLLGAVGGVGDVQLHGKIS